MQYKRKLLIITLAVVVPPLLFFLSTLVVRPDLEFQQRTYYQSTVYVFSTTTPPLKPRLWMPFKAESEVRQVVFAKVHKAASSTVQNILLRFAMFRDLNLLLGNRKLHLSDRVSEIKDTIPHPDGADKKFDILCSHTVYNAGEIAKYFNESAVRIAILREPLRQAVSALAYYTTKFPSEALKKGRAKYPNDPINGFLQHPEDFYDSSSRPTQSYINNRMSLDLGFDLDTFERSKKNETRIKEFLKEVEEEFNLVLLSDYFHESMILMKRYLNWPMKDILFMKRNEAKYAETSVWRREIKLNASISRNFRKWDIVDYRLYEHFKPIFLKKIKQEPRFMEEVEAYKAILKNVETFCAPASKGKEFLYVPRSDWTEGFTLTKFDCVLMSMNEFKFIRQAQIIQWMRYKYAQNYKAKKKLEHLQGNLENKTEIFGNQTEI